MISSSELETGQAAYDRIAAFAGLRRRRMELIYALFPVLLVLAGSIAWVHSQKTIAVICAASAVADAIFAGWNWRRLRLDDKRNRALLARMQVQHGDTLPWLQAERHMAEIRRIQAEETSHGLPPDNPR
jgi:hypothetical protein